MRNKDLIPKFQTLQAHEWCLHYNSLPPTAFGERLRLLKSLLQLEGPAWIESGFQCATGPHITLGARVFMNYCVTLEDLHPVRIGDNTLIGPHSRISTLFDPGTDSTDGAPICIGSNVWIGANVTIGPGVHLGDNCVIGAGSVISQNIPPDTVAYGQASLSFKPLNNHTM